MKLMLCFCAAFAVTVVMGAASDLPQLDSTAFDFKYEMDVLPTAQDLDNDGFNDFTGGGGWLALRGDGIARFDMSASSVFLQSQAAAGSDGGVWKRYAPTAATGYTIETRLRVISQSGSYAIALTASEGSTYDSLLSLTGNAIGWGNPHTNLVNFSTTDAFHTYRVAKIPEEDKFVIWCDGNLVTNGVSDAMTHTGLNRLILGSINSTYKSVVDVDYLRFTKGAYAPHPPEEKDSSEFPHKYEMNSDDERFSPTGNASGWTLTSGEAGTAELVNGVLSVAQPNTKMRYWMTTGPLDDSVANSSSFTFETRLRIKEGWSANCQVVNFWVGVPGAAALFSFGESNVMWRCGNDMPTIYPGDDNTDKMHVFRVIYSGSFTIWRDGVKIGEDLPKFNTQNGVRFGIVSTSNGGSFDIDYIRWTLGAYLPPTKKRGATIIVR